MLESKSSILFRHWLKAHPYMTAAFEMKDTHGKNSLSFSEVSRAQLDYLLAIRSDKGILIRCQAVAEGMPDYIYLRNEPSYVVIKYPKSIALINPESFISEMNNSLRRSLTEGQAKKISTMSIDL